MIRSRSAGRYLIEAAPGRSWLVSFYVDGRTGAWGRRDDAVDPPPWTPRLDRVIEHGQGHHHGNAITRFALRGGILAVLSHEELDLTISGPSGDAVALLAP